LDNIHTAQIGDNIYMGIFYISDVKVLSALSEAAKRGVNIQIIADPNKDAFGLKKNGTPNRMALSRLAKENGSIQIRWYHTNGEQYHSKLVFFEFAEENRLILGSANYTRRNIEGYNLESNIEVITSKDSQLSQDITQYFYTIWNNTDGDYTVEFEQYQNDNPLSYWRYRIQEFTGLSAF
jgi:phosphatidylserine/phosphatidylglycerophosphate/cardiolipin synthase-like enzyme